MTVIAYEDFFAADPVVALLVAAATCGDPAILFISLLKKLL